MHALPQQTHARQVKCEPPCLPDPSRAGLKAPPAKSRLEANRGMLQAELRDGGGDLCWEVCWKCHADLAGRVSCYRAGLGSGPQNSADKSSTYSRTLIPR